ncbi:hypothetical protein Mgra_00006271 [Meloidogyne graminicola]|uniref:Uncharacterized protein n=1 Tax=Meloidogyne graminicola TaxID=189291 RepID=A0A8S9ZLZ0_9BILA|nr:hypothetical protein Mgra_00006271 [Meloidogyne graminicola]
MLNNSSNIPLEIYIFGYFIGIIELILHFLIIFISFLNFFILITTNILHPNLKILLLIQSLIILLFEIQRWIMVFLKFICLDIFRPGDQFLQITENIRTSRQLAPVFFCHLLDNINYSILTYFIYFNIFIQSTYKQSLYYAITYIFTCLIEGIIQITVLTYHPTLRKTLLEHLKCLNVFKTKIYPNNTTITSITKTTNITTSIKNIQGLELISQTNADLHFKMLIKIMIKR